MDCFELAQRAYLHEAERLSDLNQSVSLPLALVIALLTGIISMLTAIAQHFGWAEFALVVLSGVAIITLLSAIKNIVRATVGYRYAHPATIADQFEWRDNLISGGISPFSAERDLSRMLEKEYADCAKVNAENNDRKAEYLESARHYIVFTVCVLAMAALPYLIVKSDGQAAVHNENAGKIGTRR